MRSRRGPECLGVRASWPPVVAFVVMNDRPAPRCKRRRYRCAVLAQPIRISTVRYALHIFLACVPTRDREIRRLAVICERRRLVRRSSASERRISNPELNDGNAEPDGAALPRPTAYRTEYTDDTLSAPSSGNARAPCHGRPNGRSPAAGSSWPVSFSSAPASPFRRLFRSLVFSGALDSGAAVDVAAGAVPPLGAPCASATPAGRNTRAAADAATTRRDSFCMGSSGSNQFRFRPDPITSAAVRTPGFWRGGRAWTGCAWPGCRS